MFYVLILTTYLTQASTSYPNNAGQSYAIAQSTTTGFTTEQACKNAGIQAVQNKPPVLGYDRAITVTFQCSSLSL